MHRLRYSRSAIRSMRKIAKSRTSQIMDALEALAEMENPTSHHNVKAMKGDWAGSWRMRIGSYRAIFKVNPDPEAVSSEKLLLINVAEVGSRGDIY
jgi:mRNA-degrading endonuclease RelE of RelBE toxin-antitoxin system